MAKFKLFIVLILCFIFLVGCAKPCIVSDFPLILPLPNTIDMDELFVKTMDELLNERGIIW